jgi:5-methylcytosine-specific restriction enzyme A
VTWPTTTQAPRSGRGRSLARGTGSPVAIAPWCMSSTFGSRTAISNSERGATRKRLGPDVNATNDALGLWEPNVWEPEMPYAALRPCAAPKCGTLVRGPRSRCPTHARQQEQQRPNLQARKLYGTPRWQALRQQVLSEEPYCRVCQVARGTNVDHIERHEGIEAKFFARNGLQSLCHSCHSTKTQRGE